MKIPIVDEQGNIIGSEERSVVHANGLLHQEVMVIIRLPNNKVVFQKRSMLKDTNPGKVTYSASGHVEEGQTPLEAAIRELEEETGIKVPPQDLRYLGQCIHVTKDPKNKIINNSLKYFYGHNFNGSLGDLKIEENEGVGFEEHTFEEIKNLNTREREKYVDSLFYEPIQKIIDSFIQDENKN